MGQRRGRLSYTPTHCGPEGGRGGGVREGVREIGEGRREGGREREKEEGRKERREESEKKCKIKNVYHRLQNGVINCKNYTVKNYAVYL